jgi:hypothetical protein
VNQLIESANQPDANDNKEKEKEKKPRGRKPKNNDSTPNESSPKESSPKEAKEAKEKKPRGRKPKQTEAVVETSQPASTSDATNASDANDEAEDTEVSRFVHGGKSFLRDRDNNLYDELSHEPVGEYDPANDSVVLL